MEWEGLSRMRRSTRGSGIVYAILALVVIVALVAVFLLQPVFFTAALALLLGVGLVVVGPGPIAKVLGAIIAVAGIVLAILAATGGGLTL